MNNTKVLLIDAHEISREGLKLLLHSDSYDVVGAIRSLEEARTAIAEGLRPDLVLFVLEHLGESAVALQQIRAGFSAFKFVIITHLRTLRGNPLQIAGGDGIACPKI